MRLVLHPKVYADIDRIMEYYEQVGTPELANEFYAELRRCASPQQTPDAWNPTPLKSPD